MTTLAISLPVSHRSSGRPWLGAIPALAALGLFAAALTANDLLADGDTWWHLVAGNLILDSGVVPHTDPFSFTFAGKPWTAHEWLAEVLFALAYRAAGWSGVVLLTGVAAGATAWIVGRRLERDLSGVPLLLTLLLGCGLVMAALLARPHILAMPALALWVSGLLQARDEGRAPSPVLLLVMALWANLHGGFAVGIALVGPFALEALIEAPPSDRVRVALRWAAFGIGSLAAACLTPHGIGTLLFPFQLMSLSSLAQIGEWQPINFSTFGPFEAALLALIGVSLRRPIHVPLLRLVLLAGLIHLALTHGRHQLLLGVIGPMILSRSLGETFPAGAVGALGRSLGGFLRTPMRVAALAAAAALIFGAVRVAVPVVRTDGEMSPISALAAIPADLRNAPVLNAYGFGGHLIWAGVRPFIDGRADMYGDAFMNLYVSLSKPDPRVLTETLARYDIRWTIFRPEERIVDWLDRTPGWRRIYEDKWAVVHVRDDAAGTAPAR